MDDEIRPCPECAQGKHQNCTFAVLVTNDEFRQCPCMIAGHKAGER